MIIGEVWLSAFVERTILQRYQLENRSSDRRRLRKSYNINKIIIINSNNNKTKQIMVETIFIF